MAGDEINTEKARGINRGNIRRSAGSIFAGNICRYGTCPLHPIAIMEAADVLKGA
jgi:hypothetical protein